MIVLEDGSEDMCTTELNEVIIKSLARKSDILIAHLDDDGELLTEYIVPLAIAA